MNNKTWMFVGIGVGVVGAAAIFAHKRHGGTMSLDSFKTSFNDLMRFGKSKAEDAAEQIKDLTPKATGAIHKTASAAADKAKEVTTSTEGGTGGYPPGSSGYTPGGFGGNGR